MSLKGFGVTHNLSASQKSPLCEGGDREGVAGSVRKASTLHPATPPQPLPLHKGKGEYTVIKAVAVSQRLSEDGSTSPRLSFVRRGVFLPLSSGACPVIGNAGGVQ